MRAFRGRNVLFFLALLAAAFGSSPARADACYPSPCTGTISNAWISPGSGEVANTVAGNGTFGFQIDPGDPARWAGRHFRLHSGRDTADLDIYFFIPSNDTPWDTTTGVHEGPGIDETGAIPAGTQRAFVMISYTTVTEQSVPFTLTVA